MEDGTVDELSFVRTTDSSEPENQRKSYKKLLDEINDAVYIINPNTGEFLGVNQTACERLGYERAQFREMSVWEISTLVDSQADFEDKLGVKKPDLTQVETKHERADGTEIPVEVSFSTFDIDGEQYRVVISRDITERKAQEQELETTTERYRTMLQAAPDPIFITDIESGRIIEANEAAADIRGVTREELTGTHYLDCHPSARSEQYRELFKTYNDKEVTVRKLPDGSQIYLVTAEGDKIPVEINTAPIEFSDHSVVFGVFRVIKDQLTYEETLTDLDTVGRALYNSQSATEVGEHLIETVRNKLGFDCIACYRYDADDGTFHPVVSGPDSRFRELAGELPVFDATDKTVWEVFLEEERMRFDDVDADSGIFTSDSQLRSGLLVPIGTHGILVIGDRRQDALNGRNVALVETLSKIVEAALDKIEYEQELDDRADRLDKRRTEVDRLEEMTHVFRKVSQVAAGNNPRQEIERTVCQKLVDIDELSFAWIGELDAHGTNLQLRGRAGEDDGYLHSLDLQIDADEPGEPALATARTGESKIVGNTRAHMFDKPWRKDALRRGFQSAMSAPIGYQDNTKGVLTVYAEEQNTFDEYLQSFIHGLGDVLAFKSVAAERTKALIADTKTELEFEITSPGCFFLRFTDNTDCTINVERIRPKPDGIWDVSVSVCEDCHDVCGDCCEVYLEHAKKAPEIDSARPMGAENDTDLRLSFSEPFIVSNLASYGIVVRKISAEGAECRVTVAIPSTLSNKTAAELVSAMYPESQLIAKRQTLDTSEDTGSFKTECISDLTSRQQEVLQEAYRSGYFESPKGATGKEIAETLDLSASAFHNHLRGAEKTLVENVFGITEELTSDSSPDAGND